MANKQSRIGCGTFPKYWGRCPTETLHKQLQSWNFWWTKTANSCSNIVILESSTFKSSWFSTVDPWACHGLSWNATGGGLEWCHSINENPAASQLTHQLSWTSPNRMPFAILHYPYIPKNLINPIYSQEVSYKSHKSPWNMHIQTLEHWVR